MLNIYFGWKDNSELNVDDYFFGAYLPEWLEDPLVKDMVLDIDKTEIKSPNEIVSSVLGGITVDYLSGGVKSLILMLYDDTFYTDLLVLGENCAKWLGVISKQKDITCCISNYDLPFPNVPFKRLNDNKILNTNEDWILSLGLIG